MKKRLPDYAELVDAGNNYGDMSFSKKLTDRENLELLGRELENAANILFALDGPVYDCVRDFYRAAVVFTCAETKGLIGRPNVRDMYHLIVRFRCDPEIARDILRLNDVSWGIVGHRFMKDNAEELTKALRLLEVFFFGFVRDCIVKNRKFEGFFERSVLGSMKNGKK